MPLYRYQGQPFSWEEIERYVAPAFTGDATAVRSDFLRVAGEQGAPDDLIDLLDSLNEGKPYADLEELREDLVAMGYVRD